MQSNDLREAGTLSLNYGVKCLAFGPPGGGKTPAVDTAPRPVLLATEPGLRSLKGSKVPTWEAPTAERVDEFKKWWFGSTETKNYDTLCIDSLSQMAELYLVRATRQNKHGLAAYGQMSEDTFLFTEAIYFQQYKHAYLVCKEEIVEEGQSVKRKRPYFPGKDLHSKIPHRYDLIMRCALAFVPGVGERQCFQTGPTLDAFCRSRQSPNEPPRLAMYEPINLTAIFTKLMAP